MLLPFTTLILVGGSLAAVSSSDTSDTSATFEEPREYPDCQRCLTKSQVESPGVGFSLSASYGTAAIRYHNGSTIGITKVEGTPEYISMMQRFSSNPPPCDNPDTPLKQSLCDIAARRRFFRKRLGLPATADVATLSELISSLASAASSDHGIPITSIFVTLPKMPGVTSEDILDALEYTKLNGVGTDQDRIGPYSRRLSELPAAFAISGGMCKNWTRVWDCSQEEWYTMPVQEVYAVGYSNWTLSTGMVALRTGMTGQYQEDSVSWEFGKGAKGSFSSEKLYWEEVKKIIQYLPRTSGWPIGTLLVLGEEGKDEDFLRVLKKALVEIQGHKEVDILFEDAVTVNGAFEPLYLAAKGAATIAKRSQEVQTYCEETDLCRRHRLPLSISDQDALTEL